VVDATFIYMSEDRYKVGSHGNMTFEEGNVLVAMLHQMGLMQLPQMTVVFPDSDTERN
jgi:hypothetical protein